MMDSIVNDISTMIAIPGLIIVMSIGGIVLYSRRQLAASSRWTMTIGRILSARVDVREARSSRGGYYPYHFPQVRYEYNVNARSYTGDQLNLGVQRGYLSQEEAEKVLARYPVGGMVEVYYDPNDPARAVLERGSGSYRRVLTGIILMILVVAVLTITLSAGLYEIISGVTSNPSR